MTPLEMLRHHVSGAIARGEKQAITEIAPARNAKQLALAVINTGASYSRRLTVARSWPELARLSEWDRMARAEAKAPHYEGMTFTRADIDAAAVEIDAYMAQHVSEF